MKRTHEAAQREFVAAVRQLARYWATTKLDDEDSVQRRVEGIAFSILCILDGVSGSCSAEVARKAIRGPLLLHELYSEERAPRPPPSKPPARFDWSAPTAPTHCPECGEELRPGKVHLCYGGIGEDVAEGFIDPDVGDR